MEHPLPRIVAGVQSDDARKADAKHRACAAQPVEDVTESRGRHLGSWGSFGGGALATRFTVSSKRASSSSHSSSRASLRNLSDWGLGSFSMRP